MPNWTKIQHPTDANSQKQNQILKILNQSIMTHLAGDSDELADAVGVELADLVLNIVVGEAEVELLVRLAKLITHLGHRRQDNC